jgi:serine O-acetyltransferase
MGMLEDVRTACRKDPALHGAHVAEVVLYPGLWAIWFHRVAHRLWSAGIPLLPRLLSEAARRATGIEIHPGARIGRRVFIDHGAGIVIGETAEVGDDCVLYHGVTLGARGWWVDAKGAKRHPTIGANVTLAVGCSVLGAVVVGDGARIGPNAVVLDDVPAGCVVVAPPSRCVRMSGEPADADAEEPRSDEVPAWLTVHEMGGL